MSNFEIVLIVLLCAVPVVAMVFVWPKIKKKEKKDAAQPVINEEIKKEEVKKEETSELPKEKKVENVFFNNDFTPEDFRGYLKHKQKSIIRPKRVDLPADFKDKTMPYIPRRRRRMEEKPKTVAEEIRSLSPELKALIFTGALDKKDFD